MFAPIWTRRDKRILTVLSILWLVSVAVFWSFWFRPEHVGTLWGMALVTIVVAWPLMVPGFAIFFMLRMKRFTGTAISKGVRAAIVVTKAPSEPLMLVTKTLMGALAQAYPHDTWVADEEPTPEAEAWYRKHGVLLSTRKGVSAYHNETWPRRTKCKEGNLAYFYDTHGYKKYDIVVQMDADHVPQPGYLEHMLRPFGDTDVGYVTAPSVCDANHDRSWSARARSQADSMFQGPVQAGTNDGWVPKCIGSHYAVRTTALKEVGGLGPELAEDYTTTLMLNAAGWKGVAAYDARAVGQGPHSFGDIVVQDFQWARSLITVFLSFFPRYIGKLSWRHRAQFSFTQLWYPVTALVWAAAIVVPIAALLTGVAPVRVSFLQFLSFYAVPYGLALVMYVFGVHRGHMRPATVKGVSWEMALFELARWPWIVIAFGESVLSALRGKTLSFRVTAKRPATAALPASILIPYVVVIAASVLAIVFRRDNGLLDGYFWFTVFFAFAYAFLIAAVTGLHIREMIGKPLKARALSHVPHFTSFVALALLIGVSAVSGTVQSTVATETLLPPVETGAVVSAEYTVQPGDSLWRIAESVYGDGTEWTRFSERVNPDLILPGERIEYAR